MSDGKCARATIAAGLLEAIILERFLINMVPKNGRYSLKTIKNVTGFNFLPIRNYMNSKLFTINKPFIEITDDNQLLSEKSKTYYERIIKKLIFPSKYENDEFGYYIEKLFDDSYYTSDEKSFIDLMCDKLLCTLSNKIVTGSFSYIDLLKFNLVNSKGFNYVARDVYNAIIQKKLYAGDNIMSFITNKIKDKKVIYEKLESSYKFDLFFNENAILQCDFNTNKNVLIKNFLNLTIYNFNDFYTRVILLLKLNSKYSFFIKDKTYDFE